MRRSIFELPDLDPRTVAWILIVCAAAVILFFHPAFQKGPGLNTIARTPQPAPGGLEPRSERAGAPDFPTVRDELTEEQAEPPPPPVDTSLMTAGLDRIETAPESAPRIATPITRAGESWSLELTLSRWPDLEPIGHRSATLAIGSWRAVETTNRLGVATLDLPILEGTNSVEVRVPGFQSRTLFLPDDQRAPSSRSLILRPESGYVGRVLDPEGRPVAGVDVLGWFVEAPRPKFGTEPTDETDAHLRMLTQRAWCTIATKTNWKGYFYLAEPDLEIAGQLTIVANAPNHSTGVTRVDVPRNDIELPAIQLYEPILISGTVVDAKDRPLEGAAVYPLIADGASIDFPPAVTNASGRFDLIAPRGSVMLYAEKVGYQMQTRRTQRTAVRTPPSSQLTGERDVDDLPIVMGWDEEKPYVPVRGGEAPPIVLERTYRTAVFVYESGTPGAEQQYALESALLRLTYPDVNGTVQEVRTNRDGVAWFPLAPRSLQPVQLELALSGYDYARPRDRRNGHVTWWQEQKGDPRAIRMARVIEESPLPTEVEVRGHIPGVGRDERAFLRVYAVGEMSPGVVAAEEIEAFHADAEGAFRLRIPWNRKARSIRVVAEVGEPPAVRFGTTGLVAIDELEDQDLRLRLEPAARVVLKPLFPEEPGRWNLAVSAASAPGFPPLWTKRLSVDSAHDPEYTFDLPVGATVDARCTPFGAPVSARVSELQETVEVLCPATFDIRGRVAAGAATPAGLYVGCADADGNHAAYSRPEIDGSFRFENCPRGVYDLFLYARESESAEPVEHRETVRVLAVERVVLDTDLRDIALEDSP